jgi:hypothetical protein
MPTVEGVIDILATPDIVWDWLTSPEKQIAVNGEYIKAYGILEGEQDALGTKFYIIEHIQGRDHRSECIVTESVKCERFAFHADADFREKTGSYQISPISGGSRLRFQESIRMKGRFVEITSAPFVKYFMKKAILQTLLRLKTNIEDSLKMT